MPPSGRWLSTVPGQTIRPQPRAVMPGTTALVTKKAARISRSALPPSSPAEISSSDLTAYGIRALRTSTSTSPRAARTCPATAAHGGPAAHAGLPRHRLAARRPDHGGPLAGLAAAAVVVDRDPHAPRCQQPGHHRADDGPLCWQLVTRGPLAP